MRKTAGTVTFGGPVAYCPQMAWIQVGFRFRGWVTSLTERPAVDVYPGQHSVRSPLRGGALLEGRQGRRAGS